MRAEKYRFDLRARRPCARSATRRGPCRLRLRGPGRYAKGAHLEQEISTAAQAQLDEQRQDNMLVKETIDRMLFGRRVHARWEVRLGRAAPEFWAGGAW
ncbi:hypothetical protein B0H12DRAFT_828573 [Mycena haematopus]|nr:hypothetical protein B0H12DRAFT_828573 [Mycena haematopus]